MRSNRIKFSVISSVFLLLGLMVLLGADQGDGGAAVVGVVKFDGPVPERKPIPMIATIKRNNVGSRDECSKLHEDPVLDESAIVSEDGELANVFVYVKKGLPKNVDYAIPKEPVFINQKGCMFRPHVQGVRVGQEFVMRNSDPVLHNVRSYALRNRGFNIAQLPATKDRKKVFTRPERAILVGCDIHKWMRAFVFAMDHPFFAVSNEKGQFKIAGLPAGNYTLAAWHEKYGEQETTITVGSSGTVDVGFSFKEKGK